MKINNLILLLVGSLSLLLTSCSTAKLNYTIDPDFSQLAPLIQGNESIYLSVSDQRNKSNPRKETIAVTSDIPDGEALKEKLTQYLKEHQFKIINRVLLAGLGIEVGIKVLQINLEDGILKSKLSAKSSLEITIHKKSTHWSKTFKATRNQEIANPVNSLDTTGIVNQMLTKQFDSIFTDQELVDFISI